MKRCNKKGFTIVELVIVIAVIAILAAVLIPTIAGLVKKANLSADQQAVRQMNIVLAEDEAFNGAPKYINEVRDILDAAGINAYSPSVATPLTKGYVFGWNPEDNRVYLVEESKWDGKYVLFTYNVMDSTDTEDFTSIATSTGGTVELTATGADNAVNLVENLNVADDLYIKGQVDANGNAATYIKCTEATAERLICILASNVSLTLENVVLEIDTTKSTSGQRAISTSGGYTAAPIENVEINIINCSIISEDGYGINLTGNTKNCTVNVENSYINAYQPIQSYGDGNKINVTNSKLELTNDGTGSNGSGLITIQYEPGTTNCATNNVITVKDVEFVVNGTGDNYIIIDQSYESARDTHTVSVSGNTTVTTNGTTVDYDANIHFTKTDGEN